MEYSYEEKPRARDEYYQSPPASASPFAFAPPPLSRPSIAVHQSDPVPQLYYPPRPAQVHHNTYPGVYRDDRQGPSMYYRQESRPMYPPAPPGYYPADMPRSVSYNYAQPYVSALPPLARHTSESSAGGVDSRPSLGYSFANRLPLVDRPFKCDECVQSFNRNHDLKRHKRIHLSVKPFGCDKCGKTFSRKDALRRHWLVKGCRGEDGATAPITPTYPLNGPTPPTPPRDYNYMSRQPSDSSQQIITPDEAAAKEETARREVIDPSLKHEDGSYFEGVVGLRRDGTALIEKEPYQYPPSPGHPYQRPVRQSPTQYQARSFSPVQEKPVFAMPFAPGYQEATYPNQEMEKQAGDEQWQPSRWHRPSFPFPPPPGANYNYAPGSPVDVNGQFAQ